MYDNSIRNTILQLLFAEFVAGFLLATALFIIF
jgi:uncharacterized membrane protein